MIKIGLQWPAVKATSVVLYFLVIVLLIVDVKAATIVLFALIAFWSRLPGVSTPHPAWILLNLDLVDLFTMILAINLGPLKASLFVLFTNIWSRAMGVYPGWSGQIKDTLWMIILSFVVPHIYHITESLTLTMLVFTVGRSFLFLTVGMIIPHRSIVDQILTEIQFQASLITVNIFYTKVFGDFFDGLLEKGVRFSWILFLFCTVVMGFVYFRSNDLNMGLINAVVRKFMHKRKKKMVSYADDAEVVEEVRRLL